MEDTIDKFEKHRDAAHVQRVTLSSNDEGGVDRERYYKAIEVLLDLVGPISGALTHDKRKEVKEIREWHEWDGLSCSCGGGWIVGHNSGCPEAALSTKPEADWRDIIIAQHEATINEYASKQRLHDLNVEALSEIKATVDGDSDQSVRDIVYGLLDEIKPLSTQPPTPASGEQMEVVARYDASAIMYSLDGIDPKPHPLGAWVKHEDHEKALTAANERAERAERRLEDYQDTHTDDEGNVWHRPTAWSYFAACRALRHAQSRAENAEALNTTLSEALEFINGVIERNVRENGSDQHRMLIEGTWHTGPVVNACQSILRGLQKVARTALAAPPAKQGGRDDG